MATNLEFVEFVCSRLKELGNVRYRKMFGDYMIYVNEKPMVLLCDNIAYVKKHPVITDMMQEAETGIPYDGAKEHYILDVEHKDVVLRIVGALEKVLPYSKEKAAKKAVKESQKEFTKVLAAYADCYVNDAFGTAHRAHASTALIADYFDADHKMFGYLMEKEVKAVDKVMNDIKRPFTAIMGGSKVSTKIEIIENLLTKVDNLILAGGMTYTFMKAMGGKIGTSICEDDKLDLALDIMKKAK